MSDNQERNSQDPSASDVFQRNRCNASLYRVLATNIVRQLREGGHRGHDLLEFASEVMQAITDDDAGQPTRNDPVDSVVKSALCVTTDGDGQCVLTGAKTVLRLSRKDDGAALKRWRDDPLVRASLIVPQLEETLQRLGESAEPDDRFERIICDREGGAPIGLICLRNIDSEVGQAELHKMIGEPEHRGRGAAWDATRLIVDYGFDVLHLNRIYLRTLGGNLRNIQLNERMGFRYEGALREAVKIDEIAQDVILMAVLRAERS